MFLRNDSTIDIQDRGNLTSVANCPRAGLFVASLLSSPGFCSASALRHDSAPFGVTGLGRSCWARDVPGSSRPCTPRRGLLQCRDCTPNDPTTASFSIPFSSDPACSELLQVLLSKPQMSKCIYERACARSRVGRMVAM
jgi:hypothetical protein